MWVALGPFDGQAGDASFQSVFSSWFIRFKFTYMYRAKAAETQPIIHGG